MARAVGTLPHRWLRGIAKQDRTVATAYLDELQRQIDQYRHDLSTTK
ncbi:hypothetical protein GT354_37545 [Streptomyces sp. SID3343]|nr:hypothetical protein [Streptomyces sp. SID3343]